MKLHSNRCEAFSPLEFKNVVVGLSLTPGVLTRCPDQWVGEVECQRMGFEYLGENDQGFYKRLSIDENSKSMPLKRMILVLESPHIDEFNCCIGLENPNSIGPANGKTGFNIRKYISEPTRDFLTLSFVHQKDVFALIIMKL